jgi:hypothetical protein
MKSALVRAAGAAQRADFGRVALRFEQLATKLDGLRLKSVAATRAMDRWSAAARRFAAMLRGLERRKPFLSEADLALVQREGARLVRATDRFVAVLRQAR